MPVDPNVSDMMDELENCSSVMEEWAYKKLCDKLMGISNGLEDKETLARRTLARDMIVEKPECIGTFAVYPYIHDPEFMQGVVRAKALDLKDFSMRCAAVLGDRWKQELADAVLDTDNPELFMRLRLGMRSLLMARSGFLPQIVERLEALKIKPAMLFPKDLCAPPCDGDEGEGPGALDLLRHEPRLLRWLLGCAPGSPWPIPSWRKAAFERRLIRFANGQGGDDPTTNAPCECPMCQGLAIPTLEDASSSLAPSDCEDDGCESPCPPATGRPPRRTFAARARAATQPYQRRGRE